MAGILAEIEVFIRAGMSPLSFLIRMSPLSSPLSSPAVANNKLFWLEPFAGTASQHYYGQTLKWKEVPAESDGKNQPSAEANQDQDYIQHNGFRPIIYIARGGHGTYFREGEFYSRLGPGHAGTQHQYEVVGGMGVGFTTTDVARPIQTNPYQYQLREIEQDDRLVRYWLGHWGETNATEAGKGPRSPQYRGNGTWDGSGTRPPGFIYMLQEPLDFHNAYRKSDQEDRYTLA